MLESVGIMGLWKLLELAEHHESVNEITIYSNLHVTNIGAMLILYPVFAIHIFKYKYAFFVHLQLIRK